MKRSPWPTWPIPENLLFELREIAELHKDTFFTAEPGDIIEFFPVENYRENFVYLDYGKGHRFGYENIHYISQIPVNYTEPHRAYNRLQGVGGKWRFDFVHDGDYAANSMMIMPDRVMASMAKDGSVRKIGKASAELLKFLSQPLLTEKMIRIIEK